MSILENFLAIKLATTAAAVSIGIILYLLIISQISMINYNSMICFHKNGSKEYCKTKWEKEISQLLPNSNTQWKLRSRDTTRFENISLTSQVSLLFCRNFSLCKRTFTDSISIDLNYSRFFE